MRQRHGRMPRPDSGSALDQLYPRSTLPNKHHCELHRRQSRQSAALIPHLHRHELVVQHDLLREEVRANGCFVLVGELLVHVLVHQRRLADTTAMVRTYALKPQQPAHKQLHAPAVAQDDELE